mmetsp:Transcript_17017/g.41461  ORF Transcript_17017/g.41461 Transcript_17017/m.41461 type:complete len:134 (+) Transcript_17017:254-655(+)
MHVMNQFPRSRLLLSHSRLSTCVHSVSGTRTGPLSPTCFLARHMSSTIRRKRKKYEKYTSIKLGAELPGQSSGLENPFQYSGENLEEYTEMATLSPWTPVPDSVARKIFDRADVQGDDVSRNKTLSLTVVNIC